jgi:Bacterial SH3 domain
VKVSRWQRGRDRRNDSFDRTARQLQLFLLLIYLAKGFRSFYESSNFYPASSGCRHVDYGGRRGSRLRGRHTATEGNGTARFGSTRDASPTGTATQAPLNIRTVPSAAQSGNIVGSVNNGTILKVVDVQSDWLKISQPVAGWVHQPLTATSCAQGQSSAAAMTAIAPTQQVINSARDRFAAGQLQAALALLQSVPQSDATYPQAQTTYQTMSQQWHQGHVAYQSAQQAIAQGKWQVAINQVKQVPDVRYWREQMAPLVKQAIVRQAAID